MNTPVTQEVDAYSTELIARLQGGPALFDETLGVSFADPTFQSAIATAKSILTSDDATSFLGPTLSSSVSSSSSTMQTVETGEATTNVYVNVETFIGPQTITIGNFGVCGSYTLDAHGHPSPSGCTGSPTPFSIAPGGEDIDTFILDFVTISETTTTTNTDLLTQVYELDGVTSATVPEPASWLLLATGLLGLGLFRRRARDRVGGIAIQTSARIIGGDFRSRLDLVTRAGRLDSSDRRAGLVRLHDLATRRRDNLTAVAADPLEPIGSLSALSRL